MNNNVRGNLYLGAGVIANGAITAPGLIEIDGTITGVITAESVNITGNGEVKGTTTADHIRVAGKLMEVSVAKRSLLIESTGRVSGDISYGDLEIRKGGDIQGSIKSVP